ncbi:hypothetical protein LEQ41_06335 [Streptococcus agalactiae]|nr:hypothetical protein [Streptococcus agalactiae]
MPNLPLGKNTNLSGTPPKEGDTHLGQIPPRFFTSLTNFCSTTFSRITNPFVKLTCGGIVQSFLKLPL